jgi:hypothetical protein
LAGPIIGDSRRAHRVGSWRRDVAFFEANLSAIEQLRLIIIGATVGVIVGVFVILPKDISPTGVSGAGRSSPAVPPPARTSVGPARSPAPVLTSQRPPEAAASVAPTQRPQASSTPTAPASPQLMTEAPARTPVTTIAAPPTPVPAASAAATESPTIPSTQPTPTSAPTSLIPTLPPLPTLPTPTLPSLP